MRTLRSPVPLTASDPVLGSLHFISLPFWGLGCTLYLALESFSLRCQLSERPLDLRPPAKDDRVEAVSKALFFECESMTVEMRRRWARRVTACNLETFLEVQCASSAALAARCHFLCPGPLLYSGSIYCPRPCNPGPPNSRGSVM